MRIYNRTYVEFLLQISGFGHAVLAFDHGGSLVLVLLTIIGLPGRLINSAVLAFYINFQLMKDNREPVRKLFAILCSYQIQPEALHFYLLEKVRTRFFATKGVLYDHHRVVRDAVFIYSGFVLIYGFDEMGDRQLLGIQGSGRILLGKSFTRQSSSDLELVALAGSYLLLLSHADVLQIFQRFEGTEAVARIIMADYAEGEQLRLLLLKERAEKVILSFYQDYPEFLAGGLLLDIDIASYLLIGEQTLRNVRMKLIRQGRL